MAKDLDKAKALVMKEIENNFARIQQKKEEYQVKVHKIGKMVSRLSQSMEKFAKDQELFHEHFDEDFDVEVNKVQVEISWEDDAAEIMNVLVTAEEKARLKKLRS